MKLRPFDSEDAAARACAERIAQRLRDKPDLVLALPTGRTPLGVYRHLVALHRRGEADFSRARTFNLDEFWELPADDPGSFRAYMERHLFSHVNLAPERIGFLDGMAPDADAECARYDRAISDAGGLDLALLGVGTNGHVAFNEPADALWSKSHRVKLQRETRLANAPLFGDEPSRVPPCALTMGLAPMLQAREVVLLALGETKAPAVQALLTGPLTPRCPASFLQLHPRAEVWVDRPAARDL